MVKSFSTIPASQHGVCASFILFMGMENLGQQRDFLQHGFEMGMIIFKRLGKFTKGNYRTHIIFNPYNFTDFFQLVSNNNV